jgi:hypothetical protein
MLENKAGVLALQILCFSVASAFVVQNGRLDAFLGSLRKERETGYLPPDRCDLSIHLAAWIGTTMEDVIKAGNQDLAHGLAAPHGLFGWYKDTETGHPVCLKELGGFNSGHARFLLHHFWAERKHTMKTFQEVFLPGWSLVLHILWKHLAFLDDPNAE